MTGPYENLANAIVLQAVKDWRTAVKHLKHHPKSESSLMTKAETERFFRSEWFTTLTSVDGEVLLRKLKEEAE